MVKNLKTFIFLNFIFSFFLFLFYIFLSISSFKELVFLIPAEISTLSLIYIPTIILIWLLNKIYVAKYFSIFLFSLLHIANIVDIVIYKIFKFHINSMVLNLILTPGGLETLDQPIKVKIIFVLIVFALIFLEIFILKLSEKIKIKKTKYIILFLIFCIIADKSMSAYSKISETIWITRNFKTFPLYQPLAIRSFAEKYLGIKVERDYIPISNLKSRLNYPLHEIKLSNAKKFNILVLAVDSMRFDMFDKEITPEIYSFAKQEKAFIFRNHYSGGNATRFGIFSIFYGLYGNYWFSILGERKAPLIMQILEKLNYDMAIFAAARVTYPEFDRTCFVNIPYSNIYDKPEGDKVEKDRKITQEAIEFITKKRQKPFFAFVFYDSPHGSYDYPPDMEKFKPSAKSFEHFLLSPEKIKPIFNRYKNSVYFCDSLIGKIIQEIKKQNLLKNTVILITGDHGEPFFEQGYYGHNNSYCEYEIKVPLVMYIPNKNGKEITLRTSHLDIVPTLMNILEIKENEENYSHGVFLFNTQKLKERKFLTAFSWDTAAIITSSYTVVFPLESYKLEGIKVYDSNFKEINDKNLKKSFNPLFMDFSKQYIRFYK